MKLPKPIGLFATPESMDALEAHIENYQGAERMAFTMGMGLTWNYLVDQLTEPEPWYADIWQNHLIYTVEAWVNQVRNDDTRLGYLDWVANQLHP